MDVQTRVKLIKRRLRWPHERETFEDWLKSCVRVAETKQEAFNARQELYRAAEQASFPAPKPGTEILLDEPVELNFDSYVTLVGLAMGAVTEDEPGDEDE